MASSLTDIVKVWISSQPASSCIIDGNEKIMIETELKLMDIPFNWDLQDSKTDDGDPQQIVSEMRRKLKEMLGSNSQLTFKSFCCQLTLAQELIKYDAAGALKMVLECETWMRDLKSDTCQEPEFASISEAVEYIYLGCKAFTLFKCGSIAEAKELLQKVPDLKKMDDKQRSGIYGIKAWAYMEYGVKGFLKALECISIARSKDPTMAEWHFLTGKIMSRIRHVKFPFMTVSDEEENFYRTAYKLNEGKASYILYMAQITREKAAGLFQECRYDRQANQKTLERLKKMNEEALGLYKKMIQSNQNDSNILARSAFGMVKLPRPYQRIDLAVEAIEQALELAPDNPMVNHYAGLIYCRHVKDNIKGLTYLERAAKQRNVPALIDWLKLKYAVDPVNYDPIPELTKALDYEDYASTILTEMASWYLFKKDNVCRAWDHLKKVTDDHFAKNHKCSFLRMKNSCNLFEVIFDEVKLKIAQRKYRNGQEKETLVSMSKKLQEICPQSHATDYSNFKAVIMNESDELVELEQSRQFFGRSGGNFSCQRELVQSSGMPEFCSTGPF